MASCILPWVWLGALCGFPFTHKRFHLPQCGLMLSDHLGLVEQVPAPVSRFECFGKACILSFSSVLTRAVQDYRLERGCPPARQIFLPPRKAIIAWMCKVLTGHLARLDVSKTPHGRQASPSHQLWDSFWATIVDSHYLIVSHCRHSATAHGPSDATWHVTP